MDEYYYTLGLIPGATVTDIKKAFRALALEHHPDVNPSQEANRRFQEIVAAYEHLLTNHKQGLAQAYTQASVQYQARFEQVYQQRPTSPPEPVFESYTAQSAPITITRQVTFLLLNLLSCGVSLFFVGLPVLVAYLMIQKGLSGWEGAMVAPLSLAGMLVIYRTIRYRSHAFE
ncbi:J domain-containing protein [Tunicatimonas pelagia]|uniref:J domain-containing protein n=1 Tax=Tunicatimonas pelagia TaxID=931531 RepID=UPI00266526CA|nr:J domain-containing protein [Tunicatimonas pelagia]WKN43929.1 J domain-containing protein [Tunicatimonas pelagia]